MLENRINKEVLKERLENESFKRQTLSFYKYFTIEDPTLFRDQLYEAWEKLNCFGRIYVAQEGINAQMSMPEENVADFLSSLYSFHTELNNLPIKYAIEDNGKSFYKLTIKVRPKIVADGLENNSYDLSKVGTHLSALEFHNALNEPNTIVVDMRNHYESEIGKFENAYCPDTDTFKETIVDVIEKFKDDKEKQFLLYCTGGIRCEKASSFLIHHGFENVAQLHGGIIEYAQQIKKQGVQSKFYGKNFVFDQRLGESIDGQIISQCHQCGKAADTHTNCANNDCHLLFIQCEACRAQYEGCCGESCKVINQLPLEDRKLLRVENQEKYAASKIFKSRLRPQLAYKKSENAEN
jgi:UPF0176 protein